MIGTTTQGDGLADNLTIADTGNCGLTIRAGSSSLSSIFFAYGTGANGYIGQQVYNHGDNSLKWIVNGSERLRILSNGHLLLGTSTDYADANSDDVQIYGTGDTGVSITSGTSHYGSIYFGDATSGDSRNRGILRYYHGNDSMALWTNAVERVLISSGGSIGVSHDLTGTSNYNRLMLHNPHDGSCWLQMTSTASGTGANTDGLSIGMNSSNIGHIWLRENAKMMFATNGTSRMEISANGIVTKPNTPAFRAHDSNHAQTGFLTFDQIATNVGSHYNGSNGRFTAPISGRYLFTFAFLHSNSPTSYARVLFQLNGTRSTQYGDTLCDDTGLYVNTSMSMIFNLSANDTVELYNEGNNIYGSQYGAFSGILLALSLIHI